jgi:hypothetical protein
LNRNIYIKKFFGVLLLASFALSNTPTKYLHWLFANHKDFVSKTLTDSNKPQINAPGIDCLCQSNVVIAPYTMQSAVVIKSPAPVFFNYTACRVVATIYSQPIFFGLRGPPSIS